MPSGVGGGSETETPSSLALVAFAVLAGELPFDDQVERTLRESTAARHAVRACTYGHDVVALIESLLDGPLRTDQRPVRVAAAVHG